MAATAATGASRAQMGRATREDMRFLQSSSVVYGHLGDLGQRSPEKVSDSPRKAGLTDFPSSCWATFAVLTVAHVD